MIQSTEYILRSIQSELGQNHMVQLEDISLIRSKDGVHVYRGKLDNESVVVKYFEKEEFRREITNYKLLNQLDIPTVKVNLYGTSFIIMEDIAASNRFRLGMEEDLGDTLVSSSLAHWYFEFHEKGILYHGLTTMYRESDQITEENLIKLSKTIPEGKQTILYLLRHLNALHNLLDSLEQTLNYNDFYWTNIVVGKDKQSAIVFDYNFLGAGYRYSDLRNVTSSLTKEAKEVFIAQYNQLYKETYGVDRMERGMIEQQVDNIVSSLVGLIFACEKETFPKWAIEEREALIDGRMLKKVKQMFNILPLG